MKKVVVSLVTFLAILGLLRAGTARSQQYPSSGTVSSSGSGNTTVSGSTAGGQNPFGTTVYQESPAKGEIAQLLTKLKDADGDAARVEISKQLEESIAKYFDDDMKTRESELTKLEERVSKLRSQLDRRRRAKQEIIQLQLKVLVNEADGLGFSGALLFEPSRGMGGGRSMSGDFYYYNEGGQTGGGAGAVKSSTRSAPAKTEAKTENRK